MKSKALDRSMHWGTYWAALVHDYDHKGLNNEFLVKTAHPLAITYSDQSPLENHHIAAATMLFLEPECQYIRVRLAVPCLADMPQIFCHADDIQRFITPCCGQHIAAKVCKHPCVPCIMHIKQGVPSIRHLLRRWLPCSLSRKQYIPHAPLSTVFLSRICFTDRTFCNLWIDTHQKRSAAVMHLAKNVSA